MKIKLVYSLILLLALDAKAALVFKVTATSNASNLGYTNGQQATFSFILNDYAPAAPSGASAHPIYPEMLWRDEEASDPQLWSSVSGGGLQGTYNPDSYNFLKFSAYPYPAGHYLEGVVEGDIILGTIAFGNDYTSNSLGLSKDGFVISGVNLRGAFTGMSYLPLSSILPDPTDYFSAIYGTYTANPDHFTGSVASITGYDGVNVIENSFTVTSIEISPASIPEPSSSVAALGLVALAFVSLRRYRARS